MSVRLSSPVEAEELPARVGERYDVLERLGRGGMAVVYRVRDRSHGSELALKRFVRTPSAANDELRRLFEREFCVLSQLRHPSVIEVYDYGLDGDAPYYTMELLDGGDLRGRAPLPLVEACQLTLQVCSSLSLLHSRRFVHRDVSPANVRCTRAGIAKLIDFGAMVPMGPCEHSMGTPPFVAPEVIHHLNVDARTDLFSAGATLYYALTGRRPFDARALSELQQAWREAPPPPSRCVPGIPGALDDLVTSLLQIDPARRPASAFEVMQRLITIAGLTHDDSDDVSRAYFSTPTLVGRDAELRRVRSALRQALQQNPSALLFEGEAGMGRSRLLEDCVLEAKTAGAVVLRLDGRTARQAVLAGAHRVAELLLEALPDCAQNWSADASTKQVLFEPPAAVACSPQLRSREQLGESRHAAHSALVSWIHELSQRRLLVLAVDDLEGIDEPSLGLLLSLVDDAPPCRLLLLSTVQGPIDATTQAALDVFKHHCTSVELAPLTAAQSEAVFSSVFFEAPHVALVSDRIHQVAAGRPREAPALARHLLDTGRIHYAGGHWVMPDSMTPADLPASAEDALRLRVAALPALASMLAETQALALAPTFAQHDYQALVAPADRTKLAEALALLIRQGVLACSDGRYTLSRLGAARCLLERLTPPEIATRHASLARLCAGTGRPGLFEVHHLLRAHDTERALDRFGAVLSSHNTATALYESTGLKRHVIAGIIEEVFAAATRCKRGLRERTELARLLVELSVTAEDALYHRYAPGYLTQLEADSGLTDYQTGDQTLPKSERLQRALQATMTRHAATAEHERAYRLDEAIKHLALFVTTTNVLSARWSSWPLVAAAPARLEPFAELSPVLHAVWQLALGTVMWESGRFESGNDRAREVYARLEGLSDRDLPYAETARLSIAHVIAYAEVALGRASAVQWIERAEQSALHRVSALALRRVLCLAEGNTAEAQRLLRQSEVLSVSADARQMFDGPLHPELMVCLELGDLTGVKRMLDTLAQKASQYPGWMGSHALALGAYQLLRGDLPAAQSAFERSLALSDAERREAPPVYWIEAVYGYVRVLTERGRLAEAMRFGVASLARAEALEVTPRHRLVRALALAEAQAGLHAAAVRRVQTLIAAHGDLTPACQAANYETRARIAMCAADQKNAALFAQRALQQGQHSGSAAHLAKRQRLLEEAKRRGLNIELPVSGFESMVLGSEAPVANRNDEGRAHAEVLASFEGLRDARERAAKAMELLCQAANAASGELYCVQAQALTLVAARGSALGPALAAFVQRYYRHQLEQAAMSTVFTATDYCSGAPEVGSWRGANGELFSLALLQPVTGEAVGLLVLHAAPEALSTPAFGALLAAISSRLIAHDDAQRLELPE